MNKAIIYGVIVLLIGMVIFFIIRQVTSPAAPDEQEQVTCGAKPVFRYKYPSKAFPIVASDYNAEVNFTTNLLDKIVDSAGEMGIGVNVKNQVRELQEKLNQDNITFTTGMRNYFFSVNSDPCNDTLRIRYASFTEEMSRRMLELRTISAQVTTITEEDTRPVAPNNPGDSTNNTAVPNYNLTKDTANLLNSIKKLDRVVQRNKNINIKLVDTRFLPKN